MAPRDYQTRPSPRILVVDHHDSFTFTLVAYLQELGAHVTVMAADALSPAQFTQAASAYDGIVLSPGPGAPEESATGLALVRHVASAGGPPLLGVCLGHQIIAVALGGAVARAPELMHGQTSVMTHDGSALFTGLPESFEVGRYHSLAALTVPDGIRVTARTTEGTIMALAHETAPITGVQYHPESILTEHGHALLANWLRQL